MDDSDFGGERANADKQLATMEVKDFSEISGFRTRVEKWVHRAARRRVHAQRSRKLGHPPDASSTPPSRSWIEMTQDDRDRLLSDITTFQTRLAEQLRCVRRASSRAPLPRRSPPDPRSPSPPLQLVADGRNVPRRRGRHHARE